MFASTRKPEKGLDYLEETDNVTLCEFGHEDEYISNSKIDYIIHAAAPTERSYFIWWFNNITILFFKLN